MYLRAIFLLGLMLISMLAPEMAMAQNLFEIPSGDKSMLILRAIFGGLEPLGGGADPMMAGIKMFNGAVLTIGGVLVAYTILIGTIGTAHDGEMLGKKFSSAWVPIRTAAGTALVLPVIGGGYCVMQSIVAWLIMQGIGLADQVWKSFTSDTNMQFLSSTGVVSSSVSGMGYDIFKVLYCKNVISQLNKDLRSNPANELSIVEQSGVSNAKNGAIIYGASPEGNGLKENSCGSIVMPTNKVKPTSGKISGSINNFFDSSKVDDASRSLTEANKTATETLISDLDTLASNMVSTKTPISSTQIDVAISKYQDTVNKKAGDLISQLKEFKTLSANASSDGWFLAGAFYTKMAWFSDAVHRATSNIATVKTPSNNVFATPLLQDGVQIYGELLTKSINISGAGGQLSGFGINHETGVTQIDGSNSFWAKAIGVIKDFVVDPNEHPLMGLKRLGSFLMTSYITMATALITLGAVADGFWASVGSFLTTGGTANAAGGVAVIIQLIQPLMTISLSLGLILAYVLPMMPFFLWFGATIGWLVMCIEAILAAPMWAVMHLSPHGDDLVGTGGQGYRLVLSLMLRPVLMIFGLIASFVIIQVVGQLLSEIFIGAFASAQSDSFILVKFFGYLIAMPALFGWTMFVLIKKAFSMIYVIPEEMLKWFGGTNSPQLGDFANTVGGESGGAMAGAAIMATQARGLTQSLGNKALTEANKEKEAAAKTDKSIASAFGDSAENISELQNASTHDKQKFMSQYDAEKKSLGGEGTVGGEAFDRAFQDVSSSPQGAAMTTAQKFEAAKTQALDKVFGTKDGIAAMGISAMSGGSLSGGKFNAVMEDVNAKAEALRDNQGITSHEANKQIGAAFSLGFTEAKNVGPATPKAIRTAVQNQFSSLGVANVTAKEIGSTQSNVNPKQAD